MFFFIFTDGFVGDIALSRLENDVYEKELEEEEVREKEELAKMLAERTRNATEMHSKRRQWPTTIKKQGRKKFR